MSETVLNVNLVCFAVMHKLDETQPNGEELFIGQKLMRTVTMPKNCQRALSIGMVMWASKAF